MKIFKILKQYYIDLTCHFRKDCEVCKYQETCQNNWINFLKSAKIEFRDGW